MMPSNSNCDSKKRTKPSKECENDSYPFEKKTKIKSRQRTDGKVCQQEIYINNTNSTRESASIDATEVRGKDAVPSTDMKSEAKVVTNRKGKVRDHTRYYKVEHTSGVVGVHWYPRDTVWVAKSVCVGLTFGVGLSLKGKIQTKTFNPRLSYSSIWVKNEQQAINLAMHAAIRYRRYLEVIYLLKGISDSIRERLSKGLPSRIVPPCITNANEFELFLDKYFPDLSAHGDEGSTGRPANHPSGNSDKSTILQQWREYSKRFLAGQSLYDLIALDGNVKRVQKLKEFFLKKRMQRQDNEELLTYQKNQPEQQIAEDAKGISPNPSTNLSEKFELSMSSEASNSLITYQGDHSLQPEEPPQVVLNKKPNQKRMNLLI